MNVVHILTSLKAIHQAIENYMETKDEAFLRKALDEADSLFLTIVSRIQI